MMRKLLLSLVLVPAISARAQQLATTAPPAGSNWQHVQALPAGASIQVQARKSHANCYLKSVDADTLTCIGKKDVVFERTDVVSVRIPRRGRSALIGAGVGGGALAIAGFASATNNNQGLFGPNFLRGAVTAVGAVAGGVIGGVVGATTDFARSTVYRAP